MKNFFETYRLLIEIAVIVTICLLPTLILVFYKNREFVDLGLLSTAILFVIFVLPIYNRGTKYAKSKKKTA
jgi:hypothetical protein